MSVAQMPIAASSVAKSAPSQPDAALASTLSIAAASTTSVIFQVPDASVSGEGQRPECALEVEKSMLQEEVKDCRS